MAVHTLLILINLYNEILPPKRGGMGGYQVLLSYFPPTVEVAVSQHLGGAWVRAQPCSTVGSSVYQEARAVEGQGYLSSGIINCPGAST